MMPMLQRSWTAGLTAALLALCAALLTVTALTITSSQHTVVVLGVRTGQPEDPGRAVTESDGPVSWELVCSALNTSRAPGLRALARAGSRRCGSRKGTPLTG